MKRGRFYLAGGLVLAWILLPLWGQDDPLRNLMRKKPLYSQQLLEDMVLEDLAAIEEKAEDLRLLSQLSGWIRFRVPSISRPATNSGGWPPPSGRRHARTTWVKPAWGTWS